VNDSRTVQHPRTNDAGCAVICRHVLLRRSAPQVLHPTDMHWQRPSANTPQCHNQRHNMSTAGTHQHTRSHSASSGKRPAYTIILR
jgi:hypothetical protein